MKRLYRVAISKITYSNTATTILLCLALVLVTASCKKMIVIEPPTNSITTAQTFATEELATAAIMGIYSKMINASGENFSNGAITIYSGTSADELLFFSAGVQENLQFQMNNLTATNSKIANNYWGNAFSILYAVNACIDGLAGSSNLSDATKRHLTGQAKLVRAFTNFYLVNLFGGIPLVNNINWRSMNSLNRSTETEIYEYILFDLHEANTTLPADFAFAKGQRTVPTKWAAQALLARVYLYLQRWENAEKYADSLVHSSSLFQLTSTVNDAFKTNSNEAIWQLQQSNSISPFTATQEGFRLIPLSASAPPFVYITPSLLAAFDQNDIRKQVWIDSTIYQSVSYYYPRKYKIGRSQAIANGSYTEYYTLFRLAEIYLIRAEARLKQHKVEEAISDLNITRQRAGLSPITFSQTADEVLALVEAERRTELFCEWGHRWLDLKRWKKATQVLLPLKGTNWQETDQLYPIPFRELTTAPNFYQNPGY